LPVGGDSHCPFLKAVIALPTIMTLAESQRSSMK
jgi:hypothetical protein